VLFVNQSATSAILMIAVAGTATGSERLSDALIGSGVTLVITVILFPAAPLSLIQDAVQRVSAALRDTLARLAELPGPGETANPGETPRPDWALAVGQRIQRQLTGLQEARSTARQVASLAPRRWPERARVRQAGEQTVALHLLAATVVSLAQACTTGPTARPPHPPAVHEALGELASAFAVLAGGGDASASQAARHAIRARALVAGSARAAGQEQAGGPRSQLVVRLVETCADDTLRLTGAEITPRPPMIVDRNLRNPGGKCPRSWPPADGSHRDAGLTPLNFLDGESQVSEHLDRTALPALEITGGQALAGGELIGRAQNRLRRVAALLPEELIGRGPGEAVLSEERLWPQPVVLLYRAQHLSAGHEVPGHHAIPFHQHQVPAWPSRPVCTSSDLLSAAGPRLPLGGAPGR
jgi:hypothetical protein